jgi:hypothetical protein
MKRLLCFIPGVALDRDSGTLEAQHVDRVQLAATASGKRAGLDDQRGMPGNLIPLGCVADVAHVEMAGQKDVGAGGRELPHRHVGPSDQMLAAVPRGEIKGMVGHDDLAAPAARHPAASTRCHLRVVQPSTAAKRRAARCSTDRDHFHVDTPAQSLEMAAKSSCG